MEALLMKGCSTTTLAPQLTSSSVAATTPNPAHSANTTKSKLTFNGLKFH